MNTESKRGENVANARRKICKHGETKSISAYDAACGSMLVARQKCFLVLGISSGSVLHVPAVFSEIRQ